MIYIDGLRCNQLLWEKSYRRVTRMRNAMANGESILLLENKTAMYKKSYLRSLRRIDQDRGLSFDWRLRGNKSNSLRRVGLENNKRYIGIAE